MGILMSLNQIFRSKQLSISQKSVEKQYSVSKKYKFINNKILIKQNHMIKSKPKWLAIGKQTGKYQTRSQLLPLIQQQQKNIANQQQSERLLKIRSLKQFRKLSIVQFKKQQSLSSGDKVQDYSGFFNNLKQIHNFNNSFQNFQINNQPVDNFYNKNYILQNPQKTYKQIMKKKDQFNPFHNTNNESQLLTPKSIDQWGLNSYSKCYDSIVLQQQNINQESCKDSFTMNPNVINIDSSHSQIIESLSFVQENQNSPKIYYPQQQFQHDQEIQIQKLIKSHAQQYSKSPQQNLIYKIRELQQMIHQLKIIQQTVVKEIQMCQKTGKMPLFLGNKMIQEKLSSQIQQIFIKLQKKVPGKATDNSNQSFTKALNSSFQHQVLDSSFRELNNGKMIQKMIKNLQQKQQQIIDLQQKLFSQQNQITQKQSILISKLQLINQLHQQLSAYKDTQHTSNSRTASQTTGTFSPQIQKLLRQKQIKNLQLVRQIELTKQKNQHLINQKQSLQEQIFTLEQKVIGVQMEIQQNVRKGIQQISYALEQKIRNQHKANQVELQNNFGKNQCYLETIDTLSRQITDLNQKCKSYEKYIKQQEKIINNNISKISANTQHKQDSDLMRRKIIQLEAKQSHLAAIQNELEFKEKKIKDLEIRLNKEAAQFQRQHQNLERKDEEIEKYQQQLNGKEQQLYVWEKSLTEQDKLLNRKINQFQRDKSLFETQKSTVTPIIQPYPSQTFERRNVIVSPVPYQNSFSAVISPRVNPQFVQNYVLQPKVYYDRAVYQQQVQQPQQYYQPTYEEQNDPRQAKQFVKSKNHYPVANQVRRSREQKLNESLQQHHGQYESNLRARSFVDNHQNIQFNASYQHEQQHHLKNKTESVKIRPGSALNENYNENYNGISHQTRKNEHSNMLYLSTTNDKKSILVEQILSRRRNEGMKHQTKASHKNSINQIFTKSQLKRIKSPLGSHLNYGKEGMDQRIRQHREKFESRRVYQKPSKDLPQNYRQATTGTNSSVLIGRKAAYDPNKETSLITDKSYSSKNYTKASILGSNNINQKLQKLKQQIKREVKALQ